jgi:hypothetical protein
MPGIAEALDPAAEATYRRGYRHGARAIVAAAFEHLPRDCAEMLRDYVEHDLLRWSEGESFQPPQAPTFGRPKLNGSSAPGP